MVLIKQEGDYFLIEGPGYEGGNALYLTAEELFEACKSWWEDKEI